MDPIPALPSSPDRLAYTRTDRPANAPGVSRDLDAQRQAIASAGAVDHWFHDDHVAGHHPLASRPALRRLLATLRPGDRFAVSAIDRLGADLQDLADTLRQAVQAGATLEVAGTPWRVDLPTLNLLALHDVLRRADLSESPVHGVSPASDTATQPREQFPST